MLVHTYVVILHYMSERWYIRKDGIDHDTSAHAKMMTNSLIQVVFLDTLIFKHQYLHCFSFHASNDSFTSFVEIINITISSCHLQV